MTTLTEIKQRIEKVDLIKNGYVFVISGKERVGMSHYAFKLEELKAQLFGQNEVRE